MPSNDLVVVLPGIMGSTLGLARDNQPPEATPVWAPSAGALWRGLTGGPRITDYPLPDGIGDDHPGDGIEPLSLMPTIHALPGVWTPIKGYTELIHHLEGLGYHASPPPGSRPGSASTNPPTGRPANLLPVPYDWRLSNRYNAQRLATLIEPALDQWRAQGGQYVDAQVVLICHSMGGLIARWYLANCGGHHTTRKLITLGTPWRGATKALAQLINGIQPTYGPFSIDLTDFAHSLVSLYQLLPEYAAIENPAWYQLQSADSAPELEHYLKATETTLPISPPPGSRTPWPSTPASTPPRTYGPPAAT